jgi:hypothetical protein
MKFRAPSSLALGILSSAVLLGLTGCASTKCPDPVPYSVDIQLTPDGKKANVDKKLVCVRSNEKQKGKVRWTHFGTTLDLPLEKLYKLFPGAPKPECKEGYCELELPAVTEKVDIPYWGWVILSSGARIPFDPAIRILP